MGRIKLVDEIDDLIKVETIFVSVTDKDGLVSNIRDKDKSVINGLPEDGLIGLLVRTNPEVLIISTGGTAKLIKEAGYKDMEISEFTGWSEMDTGLVKSMHPKLFVGELAHNYTTSDAEYMKKFNIPPIDMVIVNFYPFEEAVKKNPITENPAAFEIIKQQMDVGGPTHVHASRKGFLTTAVTTRINDYPQFAADLTKFKGCISFDTRINAMRNVSEDLYLYHKAIRDFVMSVDNKTIKNSYNTIHNPSEGGE